ncbi:MAG: KH domain-containing protein [Truepera sp.]|nr:KH domain-containing protein [Truepera sp.]
MAENDLDKYLEDIGIEMDEEEQAHEPPLTGDDDIEDPLPVAGMIRIETEGDIIERCESFLVNLLLNFDPTYAVEARRLDEGGVAVDIFGGDPGKIIGRGGRTLSALEYITNAVLNRGDDENVRINIDVGGYRRRRDDRLRTTARKVASRVREAGRPFELEPMSAAERRVIHLALADDPSVISESEGEGRNRRVVVKPS